VSHESQLKKVLTQGEFAVTAECGPPKGADPDVILKKGQLLKGMVDAVNVTDNQTAIVRMSSLAACSLLKTAGLDPVLQMVVRDRNRISLQSDILGASALGIRNVLCLSGDHQIFGNQPQALGVFDLDSIQFVQVVKGMRDNGVITGGDSLDHRPEMFIGAAANPFADPPGFRVRPLSGCPVLPLAACSKQPVWIRCCRWWSGIGTASRFSRTFWGPRLWAFAMCFVSPETIRSSAISPRR